MKLYLVRLLGILALPLIGCQTLTPSYPVSQLSATDATQYDLDRAFFKKTAFVQNILIATSGNVSDHALSEAAYLFDRLLRNVNPEITQRIRDRKILCILVGHDELTSDIPQFATTKTGQDLEFYNWRQRGFITKRDGQNIIFFAEEDVLEYDGGMQIESILVHEFGHVVHHSGFDEVLHERLKAVWKHAMDTGLWRDGYAAQRFRRVKSDTPVSLLAALEKSFPDIPPKLLRACLDGGDILVNQNATTATVRVTKGDNVRIVFGGEKACYGTVNRGEYWAEGFQIWYDTNRTMDHDHNHIRTREQLIAYDPQLAQLCEDVMGTSTWRFVSPRERAGRGHLETFDPSQSPVKTSSDTIKEAASDYYDTYWKSYWQRLADKHQITIPSD